MADKPSRALVLYGYGLAPFITSSHSHFHTVAARGSCGFLALDYASATPDVENDNLIRELAQLLDASEAFANGSVLEGSESEAQKQLPTIAERFMGMRAAIVTSTPAVKIFGEKLGFTTVDLDKLRDVQSCDFSTSELLKLLGFQDGKALDTDHFDLVFVHTMPNVRENGQSDVDYINNMVERILQVARPGSEIGDRLHLSLVMSHGAITEDDPNLSLVSLNDRNNFGCSLLFPRQSYTVKGVNSRSGIRHHCPMLIAQLQNGVTRKDMAEEFSFSEFKKLSGNLAIPADRFLYEVAFKLWKAPKYGA